MRRDHLPVLLLTVALIVPLIPHAAVGTGSSGGLGTEPAVGAGEAPASHAARVEPGLLDDLDPAANPVVVRFDGAVPATLPLDHPGLDVRYRFESLPAVFARAPASTVRALADDPGVAYIERADKPIAFDLDTATLATMAREVWDPSADNPVVDGDPPAILGADGDPVDGSGIGIAVVDTGIDTTHPDLLASDKVRRTFVATSEGVVEAPYFSPQDPHGTAVAGVAAGNGAASGGTFAGAAPGASLYSFAVKHATLDVSALEGDPVTLHPAVALDWIAAHGDDQDPPIRVVTNAWHCRSPSCRQGPTSQSMHGQLAAELVDRGVVVTWAFGNVLFTFNPEATLPVQGVLGVSSTDDLDAGTPDGCDSSSASQGHPLDPSTWPDLAAPGTAITTTAALTPETARSRVPTDGYTTLDGSSLSAGHAAGVAALLLQANPDLTPAQVEWILEDTAHKPPSDTCLLPSNRGDPTHPTSEANHRVGHGLIDAYEAVNASIGFDGIPDDDTEPVEPDEDFLDPGDRDDLDTVAVDRRLYLAGEDRLSATRPTGDQARSVAKEADGTAVFTSAPFDDHLNVTGIDSSVWMDVSTEPLTTAFFNFLASIDVFLTLERVGPGGTVRDAVTLTTELNWNTRPVGEYPLVAAFPKTLPFEPGDRARVTVKLNEVGVAGDGSEVSQWELLWGSARYPSHVALGQRAPDAPGTYRDCRGLTPWACAWLDADHPSAMVDMDGGRYQLHWEGPGGTGARFRYFDHEIARCEVPEDVAWGQCDLITHSSGTGGLAPTSCEVLDPVTDAPVEGHGKCWILQDR